MPLSPPSRSEPDEIGLEKILLFPAKLAALPGNLSGVDQSYPVSVELSLTSRCDLSCLWCSDQTLRALCPDRLDLPILARLFNDLAQGGCRGVTIEGGGEPTISPLFEPAVEAALAAGLSVGLITNGCSISRPGFPLKTLSRLQWIRVSLDAPDAPTFRALKGADRFDAVMEGLEKIASLHNAPVLGAGYVLTRLNDDPAALGALAGRLADMGLSYLHLRPVVDHPELASRQDPEAFRALASMERKGFRLNLGALADNAPDGNVGLPCLAHSLSSVITADGRVWLCGRLCVDPSAGAIGSLVESGFGDIWRGPGRLEEARLVADGSYCLRRCPQCRMTKYNLLVDRLGRLRTRDFI